MKPLQVNGRLQAALGEEPWDDLLLEHAPELARHSRREEEARPADVERESARGADRIVDHLGGGRQHRLLRVVGRHDAAALLEELLHRLEPALVQQQLDSPRPWPRSPARDRRRGAEAAVDDDRVGALTGQRERQQEIVPVVADGGLPLDREADILELLA
jgi:hypothetical protein